MNGLLASLGVSNPVLAAPMAGGPTIPAMVAAATRAGSLGFLAGGYKTAEELAAMGAGAWAIRAFATGVHARLRGKPLRAESRPRGPGCLPPLRRGHTG